MQRIEVEVQGLNEALTRMQSLISCGSEPLEYERLSRFSTWYFRTPSHIRGFISSS
jgi:hypothetical protein